MAGAEAAVHKMKVEKPLVPERFRKGSKFVKWPKSDGDDSAAAVPITLRVDENGHVLYWKEPHKDTECLEISSIRDTRFGKFAKGPKQDRFDKAIQNLGDPEVGKLVSNTNIPLTDRCFTIIHGCKLVDLTFLNFVGVEPNANLVVKEWAEFLLKFAYHPCTRHVSVQTSIEKAFTRLKLETNQLGEIPVKKVVKLLGGKPKRVEHALMNVGLITTRKDTSIDPSEFQLQRFKKLLQLCCQRPEMDHVFSELGTGARRMYLSQQKLKEIVNTIQRDPKLNEILYPYHTDDQAMDIVQNYEPNAMFAKKGQLTQEGLDAYLQSDDNFIIGLEKYAVHQDMSMPLSHYFINSSHNTYLTGSQYRSKSSAEIYRQVLLTGCRCVELDCWDGGDDEPVITHGFTLCTFVLFKEVIEAISESAFKTSPYPVVLSFENHVDNPGQQAKMAQYCRDLFGEKLLIDPISDYPIESKKPLPPPHALLNKIIVKNKKQKTTSEDKPANAPLEEPVYKVESPQTPKIEPASGGNKHESGDTGSKESDKPGEQRSSKSQVNGANESKDDEDEDSEEEGSLSNLEFQENAADCGTAMKESIAYAAMSSLVNYIQPVRFKSFDKSEQRGRSYEISSFTETSALRLLTMYPVDFVRYNRRQTSRIYPKGARMDSSNYMPHMFWNAGCQFVALNFQILDLPMQLNMALFEFNGGTGYLLKPDHMRKRDRMFDPFSKSIDGIVASTLKIKIISGQFLSSSRISTYVEVDMLGLPEDTVRKKFKTKTVESNPTNPYYNSDAFHFEKIVLPEMALLRIAVIDTGGNLVGQRFLPVEGLKPGYRYITLRNEGNQPLTMPSLFIFLQVQDYVPPVHKNFADALANPIPYIQEKDKLEKERSDRQKALTLLLDEEEHRKINPNGYTPDQNRKQRETENDGSTKNVIVFPEAPANPDPAQPQGTQTKEPVAPRLPQVDARPSRPKLTCEPFEPGDLQAIKSGGKYLKLVKDHEKSLRKFKKKHEEMFAYCYQSMFDVRRPSILDALPFRRKRVPSTEIPIDLNPAFPEEVKVQNLKELVKIQLLAEKEYLINESEKFIKKFSDVVKEHQRNELDRLNDKSRCEQSTVQRQKDLEKEQKIKDLPVNLNKQEMERKRKEITDAHIRECVDDRTYLLKIQTERENEVKSQQEEIMNSLIEERKQLVAKYDREFQKDIGNIHAVYEIRRLSVANNRRSSNQNISYGGNDDGAFLTVPTERTSTRRASGGQLLINGL